MPALGETTVGVSDNSVCGWLLTRLLIPLLLGLLKVSASLSIKEKVHGTLFHQEMASYLQIRKKKLRFLPQHIWKGVGRSSAYLGIKVFNMDS